MEKEIVVYLVEDEEFFHQTYDWAFGDSNDVELAISDNEPDAREKFQILKKRILVMVLDGNLKRGDTLELMKDVKKARDAKEFSGIVIVTSGVEGSQKALMEIGQEWAISCPKGGSMNVLDIVENIVDIELELKKEKG